MMRAMVLRAVGGPLVLEARALPVPGGGEIRVRVEACAVCRTDLHVLDGELPNPRFPIIPGHEIVGAVDGLGAGVRNLAIGTRSWLNWVSMAGSSVWTSRRLTEPGRQRNSGLAPRDCT